MSGTPRVEFERLIGTNLVENSLKAWQALTKALEKEKGILDMVIYIGSLSEAWWALTKFAAETQEAADDRAKREFELLETGVSEPAAEYFARAHVTLTKLTRHQMTTPAHETKRRVLCGLTPRFTDEVPLYILRGDFDLNDLEAGIARAESFQVDQERRNALAHALAVAHAGGGSAGAKGKARDRGYHGKRSAKRHDDDQGRNQQQDHLH